MNKVVISALIGIAVAAAAMAAPAFGYPVPLPTLMAAAAAISLGAAMAVLTSMAMSKPSGKTSGDILLSSQIKSVKGLIIPFPKGGGAVSLSIRPETKPESLEVVKNPGSYTSKDVMVTLRSGNSNEKFNPVVLKQIFLSLLQQPNFVHLLLIDKHDEFVGYIPGFSAKREFTGSHAEIQIASYVDNVFLTDSEEKYENSVNLRQLGGAGSLDTISSEAKVLDVTAKILGGFRCLVVLERGNHRRPMGVVDFSKLTGGSFSDAVQPASGGGMLSDLRPSH
ncbi:MAG: hypothetical protein HY243_13930 [Proteobacteria bacterium]|nr:hypothetical protein [Pseudomonadota bacterium]